MHDWRSGDWKRLPSVPGGVGSGMACAKVDADGGASFVLVVGEGSARAQAFDLDGLVWLDQEGRRAALREEVSYASAVSYLGEMVMLGGYGGGEEEEPKRRREVVRLKVEEGGRRVVQADQDDGRRLRLEEARAEMAVLFVAEEFC